MDLDKTKFTSILHQVRFVLDRADNVVKESQSKLFPNHLLNDAQRLFAADVAHHAKLMAHSALSQAGYRIPCDVAAIDILLAGDVLEGIEKFMVDSARFAGTHPDLFASARVNVSQLLLRTAVEMLNRAICVLEQSESISGAQIGRRGMLHK